MSWDSDKDMGSGSMKVVETVANEKLVTALDFGPMGTATARFRPGAGSRRYKGDVVDAV